MSELQNLYQTPKKRQNLDSTNLYQLINDQKRLEPESIYADINSVPKRLEPETIYQEPTPLKKDKLESVYLDDFVINRPDKLVNLYSKPEPSKRLEPETIYTEPKVKTDFQSSSVYEKPKNKEIPKLGNLYN